MPNLAQTPPFSLRDRAWQTIYRLAFPLARRWWRLRGQDHQGALVAVWVDQALLLVRSSYRTEWNFPGGSPAASTEQNPTGIIYSTPGDYEVTLAVSNLLGTDTLTKRCYITVLPAVSVKEENHPSEFYLSQNYPNPFNPITTIKYSIPDPEFVTLKVYDSLGQEVTLLVNETKQAGNYEVEFNASSLSSGIYIYKITAGKFSGIKKLMVLK